MIRKIAITIAAASLLPSALAALPPKGAFKAIGDKPDIQLDPAKSYLIVQNSVASNAFSYPITFIRRADPAEVEDYKARRANALEKARAKWVKSHAAWESANASWQKLSKDAQRSVKAPVEPVEPTDLNLSFPALDQENLVTIGPFDRFSKSNGRSTFLHMVAPGRYIFYGPVFTIAAVGGTCMCMGSIEFEVKPGQIVNAGMMKLNWLDQRTEAKAAGRPVPPTELDLPETVTAIGWESPVADATIDPRLAAYTIVPADLRASGRIPNYFGVQIDRLTPVPGVIAYDRDQIIDLKATEKIAEN